MARIPDLVVKVTALTEQEAFDRLVELQDCLEWCWRNEYSLQPFTNHDAPCKQHWWAVVKGRHAVACRPTIEEAVRSVQADLGDRTRCVTTIEAVAGQTTDEEGVAVDELKVVINQQGCKREIIGPFGICLNRTALRELKRCLNEVDEESWNYGWITVFQVPKVECTPNTHPLPWRG